MCPVLPCPNHCLVRNTTVVLMILPLCFATFSTKKHIILIHFILICVHTEATYDPATTTMTARHYFSGTKALQSTHSHLYCPPGRDDCCCQLPVIVEIHGFIPLYLYSSLPTIAYGSYTTKQTGMSLMQQLDRTTQHLSAVDLNNLQMLETTLMADRSPYLVYYKGG